MDRITTMMTARWTIADLTSNLSRLSETQNKLSSGKEISRPSDDPFRASLALRMRSELEGLLQFQRNVQDAIAWQNTSDVALSKIGDTLLRARELLVGGASGSTGLQARSSTAAEMDQLIEAIKQEANASYGGRFVFAGTLTTTRPYEPGTDDTYNGDDQQISRTIGIGVTIPINQDISELLGGSTGTPDGLISVLRDVAAHLRSTNSSDIAALGTTDLAALDVHHDILNQIRADVGAVTNRLETAQGRLLLLEESSRKLLSETEDADVVKTITEFSTQRAALDYALRAGAEVVQNSLLDFLN